MTASRRLNERAAPARVPGASLWHVDEGWALFAGPLHHNDSHAHSTAVYLAGLYGTFRLRIAGSRWMSCRSAVIRAGTPYEFDIGGDPLGVFYLEPNVAGADALAQLIANGEEVNGALVGDAHASLLRASYEQRPGAAVLRASVNDLVDFSKRRARKAMDARISRTVEAMQGPAADAVSAPQAAASAGLSTSRFQHLFTREVGVSGAIAAGTACAPRSARRRAAATSPQPRIAPASPTRRTSRARSGAPLEPRRRAGFNAASQRNLHSAQPVHYSIAARFAARLDRQRSIPSVAGCPVAIAGSGAMSLRGVRTAIAAVIVLASMQPAISAEWWMLQNTDDGRQCGPPLEADGVVLTPDEILNRFEECKLMDETPSLDLQNVMGAASIRSSFSPRPKRAAKRSPRSDPRRRRYSRRAPEVNEPPSAG